MDAALLKKLIENQDKKALFIRRFRKGNLMRIERAEIAQERMKIAFGK